MTAHVRFYIYIPMTASLATGMISSSFISPSFLSLSVILAFSFSIVLSFLADGGLDLDAVPPFFPCLPP